MSVACSKCGSRNTFVTTKGNLAKDVDSSIFENVASRSGAISFARTPGKELEVAGAVLSAIFGWLTETEKRRTAEENNKAPFVVCKSCGHIKTL